MNWTIRNRLLAGCGVLVTVIAVACLLGWQQAATSEKRISGIIKGNQADLAQLEKVEASGQSSVAARNAELEFLLKKAPAFAQAVTTRISDIRKSLGSVAEETTDATQKQTAIHAIELAGRYESAFKIVSDLLARRGLTPETGLEGELRKAAHEIEAAVKEQGIAELEIILVQCRRHEKDYLLRGDTKYMDEIGKRIEEFGKQMTLFSLPEVTKTRANACWKTYATAMRSIVDADQQIKTARSDCQQAAEQFQKEMQALSASTSAAIAASQKNALRLMASGKSFMLILLVVGVILGGVVVLVLTRSITNPIRIAVESLTLSADHTSSAAGQVSATSQSLAEGASEQAASLEETSASLEEISSMTQRNAQNVQSAKEFTSQTRATAESGAKSTQEMGQAMQGIRTASGEMRDAMNGIKAASNDVGKIIKTIDEIAFQTNILALNAAVEAARAGEAGMGFAVVADEVRNLAQRSAKAAKETADMIETSIKRSDDGVRVTDKVVASVEEVTAKSQQLEQKLAEILTKAQKVDEQVAEIASASQEQSQGISEVNMAVSQMDKVTQSNASNAEESAAAAEELNAQAEVLKDAVSELQKLVGGTPTSAKFQPNGKTSKSQPKPSLIKSLVAPKPARGSNDRDFPMPEPIGAGSATNGFKNF